MEEEINKLAQRVSTLNDEIKELNEFMIGKDEAAFKSLGISPLEQHLLSIELMSKTSAMIAMNDRLSILKSKFRETPQASNTPSVSEPEVIESVG